MNKQPFFALIKIVLFVLLVYLTHYPLHTHIANSKGKGMISTKGRIRH